MGGREGGSGVAMWCVVMVGGSVVVFCVFSSIVCIWFQLLSF